MKSLTLHIGQTKTATTSIQTFLADNRPALAANGVLYPEVPPEHEAKHQHRFLVESLYGPPGSADAAWDFLLQTIADSPLPRVLLSEEVFWHLHEFQPERRRATLEWMRRKLEGHDLRIVLYLRRQDAWVQSWHNQIVKTDVSAMSRLGLEDFVDAQLRLGLLDYARIVADWIAVFGRERLLLREFRRDLLWQGDAVADFMHHALGLDDLSDFIPVAAHQQALAQAALTFAVRFNRTPSAERFKSAQKQMVHNANPLLQDRASRLAPTLRRRLWLACHESNLRLAALWGRIGDPVFSDWQAEPTPAVASTEGNTEAWARMEAFQGDTLALMAQMFQRFEDRFARMQKRIETLEARLPPEARSED